MQGRRSLRGIVLPPIHQFRARRRTFVEHIKEEPEIVQHEAMEGEVQD